MVTTEVLQFTLALLLFALVLGTSYWFVPLARSPIDRVVHPRDEKPPAEKKSEREDVEIPSQMQRAMARQAESERERRAKIIAAEGEYQASERLRQAADRLESPTALQLRLFQTMGEIAVNQNSTIILPVPIDLIQPFLSRQEDGSRKPHRAHEEALENNPER